MKRGITSVPRTVASVQGPSSSARITAAVATATTVSASRTLLFSTYTNPTKNHLLHDNSPTEKSTNIQSRNANTTNPTTAPRSRGHLRSPYFSPNTDNSSNTITTSAAATRLSTHSGNYGDSGNGNGNPPGSTQLPSHSSSPPPRSSRAKHKLLADLINRPDLQATVFVPGNVGTLANLLAIVRETERRYGTIAEFRCPTAVS